MPVPAVELASRLAVVKEVVVVLPAAADARIAKATDDRISFLGVRPSWAPQRKLYRVTYMYE